MRVKRRPPARRCPPPAAPTTPPRPPPCPRRASASAACRSRRERWATWPRSAFVTTSTSGTSMIPAFRNWSTSPDPGWTTTATVSAASATSVSDWPTPTVSITTTSNAAASAWAAVRVARSQAAEPLAGRRRADEQPRGRRGRRRSASGGRAASRPSASDVGSTASTATVRPSARQARASADSSIDLPAPGGPVTPTMCARGSTPASLAEQRRDLVAPQAVLQQVERRRRCARGRPPAAARPAPRRSQRAHDARSGPRGGGS